MLELPCAGDKGKARGQNKNGAKVRVTDKIKTTRPVYLWRQIHIQHNVQAYLESKTVYLGDRYVNLEIYGRAGYRFRVWDTNFKDERLAVDEEVLTRMVTPK
ncbi:hypothetical protein Unana1_04200 [Umbelopsis nana]